jgi:UDP-N-acetylglucosamine 2-epimerase
MALLSKQLKEAKIEEITIHTGQHYDLNMSDIFFKELQIQEPTHVLHYGGKTHGRMTGEMIIRLEEIFMEEKPDYVLVYGDCNTTLAAALAACNLHIKVVHVEAGLRSGDKTMPEEVNRILTDHISDILLCPTESAKLNLHNEGIRKNIHVVGDLMIDLLRILRKDKVNDDSLLSKHKLEHKRYVLLTLHRQSTTDPKILPEILNNIGKIQLPVCFPIHPRTRKIIDTHGIVVPANIVCIDPVGYVEMLALLDHALLAVTDSGGLQKEAYQLKVPCVTVRDTTEWPETLKNGWNRLCPMATIPQIGDLVKEREFTELFPEGSANRIVSILMT